MSPWMRPRGRHLPLLLLKVNRSIPTLGKLSLVSSLWMSLMTLFRLLVTTGSPFSVPLSVRNSLTWGLTLYPLFPVAASFVGTV